MSQFIGEYNQKLDPKNRVVLPSAFVKQLRPEAGGQVVLKKGYGKFLVIYPLDVWQKEVEKIGSINQFNPQAAEFRRRFLMGATAPMELDSASRFLVPRAMLEFAGLKKEVVILGDIDKMELWDKEAYEHYMMNPEFDEATLAGMILGTEAQSNG